MTPRDLGVPLRSRLFLLAAAAIVPLAVTSAVGLVALFSQQREQGERAALEVARALATAIDAELRRASAVLEAIATGSGNLMAGDLAKFEQGLRRAASTQPFWRGAILLDAQGRPLINSQYPPGAALPPIAEMESFRQVLASARPTVGYLAKDAQGEWVVPLRVPIIRDGRVAFVLTAAVRPESLLDLVNRQTLSEGWVVTAADARGIRVLRWPGHAENVGTPVSGTLRKMMDAGRSEATGLGTTTEGFAVYTALSRMPHSGWYLGVGIPKEQVEAGGWRSLAIYGGGVLLSIVIGALVALYIARTINRPIAELRVAAQALGHGERPVRTGTDIREIQEVWRALTAAAEERAAGELEREELLRREKNARAEAEAANRAKDEFLAMLGHELRNPLGAVSNAAHMLARPDIDEQSRDRASGIILRQVSHLARLTDDLLDAARAVMGKIVLRREARNLADAVRNALATLRAAGRTDLHAVIAQLEDVWVEVDTIRLDQIVSNLLVNATKYTPRGGTIRVIVGREGADAVLRVADDGIGIAPELAARAFDLFVQGERDLDRAQGGLGIGLTLVRRLAELHGGSATVRSDGPGRGSEFTVRLPAIGKPVPSSAAETPGRAAARHILLVEDNEDARESLLILLEQSGHRVETASDGQEGLERAASRWPDVALVDIGLPKLDGYELARRIRAAAEDRDRPYLIALTGYGSPEDRTRAFDAGFDAHLVKPVGEAALDRALAAAPARSAARSAAAARRPTVERGEPD